MPIYEFTCPVHGRFETIFKLSVYNEIKEGIMCGRLLDLGEELYCGEVAEMVWSVPANINIGKPTKVFINNKTGDVFTPAKDSDRVPRGYHVRELKNPIERSRFEKEQQQMVDGRNQFISHQLDTLKSEARKNRHDDLKAKMNAMQVEKDPATGETVRYSLDHKDKALLEKAMNRSRKKKAREKKSEVMLAVNHQDAGNMDEVK